HLPYKNIKKSNQAIYGSTPNESTDQIKIEAPDVAENGLSVPVSVSSSIKQVENLSIFIENNPLPLIANYHLKDGMIPEFSLRVKVAKSSNIHVMVQTADKLYSSTRKIQVTLGGCAED
ncbi:MAG: thiosulfate oxidation carrier protein SoxY, partial [SAR324 cluster bacterium]|nr:thiosulfate oxidation carrier protein SoxY [SAR324 cluster bacterium]